MTSVYLVFGLGRMSVSRRFASAAGRSVESAEVQRVYNEHHIPLSNRISRQRQSNNSITRQTLPLQTTKQSCTPRSSSSPPSPPSWPPRSRTSPSAAICTSSTANTAYSACPAPDGSFCEAENIIQTCKDNQSTLGNCNDNLSGSCPGQIAEAKCVKGDGFGNASCVLVDCVGGSS